MVNAVSKSSKDEKENIINRLQRDAAVELSCEIFAIHEEII